MNIWYKPKHLTKAAVFNALSMNIYSKNYLINKNENFGLFDIVT